MNKVRDISLEWGILDHSALSFVKVEITYSALYTKGLRPIPLEMQNMFSPVPEAIRYFHASFDYPAKIELRIFTERIQIWQSLRDFMKNRNNK